MRFNRQEDAMLRTKQDLSIRELHDDELQSIQGGTSAVIYAVAAAAYKVMAANDDARLQQGIVSACRYK
jgi:bacteriocin-like protein